MVAQEELKTCIPSRFACGAAQGQTSTYMRVGVSPIRTPRLRAYAAARRNDEIIMIGNKRRCAKMLGVSAKTLYKRLSACNHCGGDVPLSLM
jgi:DNA-binding NtrC family response regulator